MCCWIFILLSSSVAEHQSSVWGSIARTHTIQNLLTFWFCCSSKEETRRVWIGWRSWEWESELGRGFVNFVGSREVVAKADISSCSLLSRWANHITLEMLSCLLTCWKEPMLGSLVVCWMGFITDPNNMIWLWYNSSIFFFYFISQFCLSFFRVLWGFLVPE